MMNDTERRRKEVIHAKFLNGIITENWSKERMALEEELYNEMMKDDRSFSALWLLVNKIGKLKLKEQNKL